MTVAQRVATMEAMRFFNTEGPVRADEHDCIPPLERIFRREAPAGDGASPVTDRGM